MSTITVAPANHRDETLWFLAAVIIIVLGAMTLNFRSTADQGQPQLYDWQLSSFHDLNEIDQAIYNALDLAGEEVFYYQFYISGDWPSLKELEEYWLPPFYKDKSWERQGEVQWTMINIADTVEKTGNITYHGSGGKIPGQSAYLLIVTHSHAGMGMADAHSVWINPDVNAPVPEVVKNNSLILNGWRQVVSYTGKMEVDRVKGS